MSKTKAGGSSRNGRDSQSKRLGVKLFGGQVAQPGNIILRQRGTKFQPGTGVDVGKDYTIFAIQAGVVEFSEIKHRTYTGSKKRKTTVSVVPVSITK